MDFALTDEQLDIQNMVSKFALNEIAPIAVELDRESRFPTEVFQKMGELGLLGAMVPEEYGGVGQTVLTCCVIAEELAAACAGTAMSYLAHAVLCVHNLACNGSDEQKRKYLPDLASGAKLGAIAMTEPNAGSDVLSMTTSAVREGDEYVLNGAKTFITNAPVADTFLVYARTDKDAGPRGISQFIIERGFPGFTIGEPLDKMGVRASPTAELFFRDCRVPAENLVKGENAALGILMGGLDVERAVGGALGVGMIRAALDKSIAYALQRQQFGQPIVMFEMVAEKIANMSMELDASRLLVQKVAVLCDQGVRCSVEAAHAKLFASEAAMRATAEAVQIFGGYGYMKEYEVERMMRDAKIGVIGGGTSEIQRMLIARAVVKRTM